jgi:hypothetical protein
MSCGEKLGIFGEDWQGPKIGKRDLGKENAKRLTATEKNRDLKHRNCEAFASNFDYSIFITIPSNLSSTKIGMVFLSRFKEKSETLPIDSRKIPTS